MALELSPEGFDPDEAIGEQQDNSFVAKGGRCHLILTKFEEYGDSKNGRHIFKFEVLKHEQETENGKIFWEYASHPSPNHTDGGKFATSLLIARGVALGLTTLEEVVALRQKGNLPPLEFADAEDRQCFATLKLGKEYEGTRRIEIGGIFHTSDPRTKDYPRNATFFAKTKHAAGGGNGSPTTATSPAEQQQDPVSPFANI